MSEPAVSRIFSRNGPTPHETKPVLSEREMEVLALLAKGWVKKAFTRRLF